jgi:hypothetical protein
MRAFIKTVRKAEQIRRFRIQSVPDGWEVTEEADNRVVRERRLQDWHRVEHARRAIVVEIRQLTQNGWREIG